MPVRLVLPEVILGPIRYPVGEAFQVLRPALDCAVVDETLVNISPRVREYCVRLDNGERIVVTERKKASAPADIDGVLRRYDDGRLEWLSHRLLTQASEDIERHGLSQCAQRAVNSWKNAVRYKKAEEVIESDDDLGLRPPQLGALFAIGMHWSLYDSPATIVMPTGTGKTETMLAATAAHEIGRLLVAVPSNALRRQTADKFARFGLLRKLNVLTTGAHNPVVGVLRRRPKSAEELSIFEDCNVIVGSVPSLAGGTAKDHLQAIARLTDVLMIDEAHHVAAASWNTLKAAFGAKPVLQFTATPFRNDGKLVGGSVIYAYPLKSAQADGYFKHIDFIPIHELDDSIADEAVAMAALDRLRTDLDNGRDHLMMARCRTVERAGSVHALYQRLAPDLHPLLIHSELTDSDERVEALIRRHSRLVVCVNMLGEGVDIPALKVAALHDMHQSLAVLLQFVGRFTRTGGGNLGDASVVANIANPRISTALESLYSEDADWNVLLREMSSDAAREHAEFIDFLEQSERFDTTEADAPGISEQSLRPTFSTLFYEAPEFRPKKFHEGLSKRYEVIRVWLNDETRTLYFVTRSAERAKWTNAKEAASIDWDLFVLHHDPNCRLLYLASTSKDSHFEGVAKAVGATAQVNGEKMFRALGRIGRLVFNNLGVSKHGRRNLSFAMYTGVDVKRALSETEKQGSRKSNISGYGWEDGRQITIGCSHKGRVWSKAAGTIPQFIRWVEGVGDKLVDDTIDTRTVIANVLIPEFVEKLPDLAVLSVDWPVELLSQSEERISILAGGAVHEMFLVDIECADMDRAQSTIDFEIKTDDGDTLGRYRMRIKGEAGFEITRTTEPALMLRVGRREMDLAAFFNDYPPLVRFVDLSEVDGNIILKAENAGVLSVPAERLEPWDWNGVDIEKESIWKDGVERRDSIQQRVAQHFIDGGFAVVFDDDGKGEAADLVCMKLEDDHIRLALVHCKFSGAAKEGERIKDVVEVASQASRSAKWPGKFKELVRHLENRNHRRQKEEGRSFFLAGSPGELTLLVKAARFKEVRPEILIVQPGVSKSRITDDQATVLGAAAAFIKQTLSIDIDIICSA